jgi:hypothetical protein
LSAFGRGGASPPGFDTGRVSEGGGRGMGREVCRPSRGAAPGREPGREEGGRDALSFETEPSAAPSGTTFSGSSGARGCSGGFELVDPVSGGALDRPSLRAPSCSVL